MSITLTIVAIVLQSLVATALAQQAPLAGQRDPQIDKSGSAITRGVMPDPVVTETFAKQAALDAMTEVELGKLAQRRSGAARTTMCGNSHPR